MKTLRLFVLIALLCNSHSLKASNPTKVQQFINNKDWNFVENKGQLADQNRNLQSEIKYYGHQGGVYLYCKTGMLSFVFTKTDNIPDHISEATGISESESMLSPAGGGRGWKNPKETAKPSTISTSRTDLVLLNSNPNAEIIASDKQEYYENFYTTGDANHGITNVHTFKTVTYKSVYSNIDMVLQAKEQGMEYSFIVHPGGQVSDIQMQWNGTEGAQALSNGGFKFSNSLGTVEETAPRSFLDGKLVESRFEKNGFKVGDYDKGKDLVIDPGIVWATYYGDNNGQGIYATSVDNSGNICFAGVTEGSSGLATSGAYQTAYGGNNDGFVAKFTSSGFPVWSTYFGGSNDDYAYGLSIDTHGNLFVCGNTNSKNGIATSGAFQSSFNTGLSSSPFDAFLAKFDNNGNLDWSTYFAGGQYDKALGVVNDTSGNAYITGNVSGYTNIATAGTYQTSYGGGYYDAFIAKFSGSGSRIWGTYFGGNDFEWGMAITIDKSGYLYISGTTFSTKGIATSGAYLTAYNGYNEGYLAKFDNSGKIVWSTYYGNTAYENNHNYPISTTVSCIKTDSKGDIYIGGYTCSNSGIATSGAHQTQYIGGGQGDLDGFVAKFSRNGTLTWGTYYGGKGADQIVAISTDSIGDIYATGFTESGTGIATTGGYMSAYESLDDAFLAKFRSNGSLNWGTYFGGYSSYQLRDNGYAVSNDKSGNVYIGGQSEDDSIATTGAFETSPSGNFLARFGFQPYKNDAGIMSILNPSAFCAGSQPVKVDLQNLQAADFRFGPLILVAPTMITLTDLA